ncbi:MAG: hypothetical protein JSV88_29320 [Candidatus Aminicenantes bacterium]|nr:MAG: hypothetical protein JSV88_29320 [Candidatus Aminicenantes bacterium]
MKLKTLFILVLILCMGLSLTAMQSVTFLQDGNNITDVIIDMSSRTGNIDYRSGSKVHVSRVWMINFVDANWDFPGERDQLSGNTDTIFLRDGGVIQDKIVDYSSRRLVWEFTKTRAVPDSQIKRIYFCCTKLPAAYQSRTTPTPGGERYSVTFLVTGQSRETPLSYLNSRKTGFTNGLQINTHDIWMINFEDNQWDFPVERRRLNKKLDTIFLKDGQVVYDKIVDFSESRKTFSLQSAAPINESKIKRIYFCCNVLPNAYRIFKFKKRR